MPLHLLSRRRFLQASSTAAAAAVLLPRGAANAAAARGPFGHNILVPRAGHWSDPDRHALAAMAVDAARAAGASYADVRLSRTMRESWTFPYPTTYPFMRVEMRGVGVRVLVNGFWGFMGSNVWTADEMARLARGAVVCAKASSLGATRERPLAPTPVVKGEWVMPVKYDPFDVSLGEKYDFFNHVLWLVNRQTRQAGANMSGTFNRANAVFASSEGSSWAQTTYESEGLFSVGYGSEPGYKKFGDGQISSMRLSPAGLGWEHFIGSGLLESIPELVQLAEQGRDPLSVDVGRYDLVCSAYATAAIVDTTVGGATELDRALGFEANAQGSSYLDRPLEMLGTQAVGTKMLSVTAERSTPGACATVKWDDEGVAPEEFQLVKDGVLVDYQTTREQVAWLAPYYEKAGRPMRSHGCSQSGTGLDVPMQRRPNLRMTPGAQEASFEELVAGVTKGVALVDVSSVMMDPQLLNGTVTGTVREIRNGKLGRFIDGAALAFRAPEFWKTLDAIGGTSSARWFGSGESKGQPEQWSTHSVSAVPARFRNAAIIDLFRKA